MLIACTNLANLLLARNSVRQREFTIRSALGAGRFRLARQLFTECLLLSVVGGALGTLGAFWGVRVLCSHFNWNEDAQAMAREISVDGRVLLFTLMISLGAGILFGLAPAIQIARRNATESLKEGSRGAAAGPERQRLQRLLVIGQVALSLFLLVGAGLFVEGFLEEIRATVGFNSNNLLTATVWLRDLRYLDSRQQRQFFQNVLQHLASLPGVHSVAGATDLPYNFPSTVPFTVEGHPVTKPKDQPQCGWFAVSPGHLRRCRSHSCRGASLQHRTLRTLPP